MSDSNWIKLNRKIWDNFIWNFEEPKYAMAWVDMLLMANYKDKKIMFDGSVITVKRGSFISSIAKLADRWRMNKRTVKRFLDLLQSDGMISYKCTNRCTTVFISNYNTFQDHSGESYTAECTADYTAECTADYTAECTQHKKVKKIKESKESKEDSLTVSKETVCSTDVLRIVEAWNSLNLSKVKKVVPGTNRDGLLKARLRDYGTEEILKAIETIKQSTFLRGGGEKGWVITFDWFIKPNNFPKVLGGNYTDNNNPPPTAVRSVRKEMVPSCMGDNYQPTPERIRKNAEWLDSFIDGRKKGEGK